MHLVIKTKQKMYYKMWQGFQNRIKIGLTVHELGDILIYVNE